jgi:hypothetical protein
MEMIPDLQIEHPPIVHEDGRVEIECGIRKERSHKYEQPMKKLHSLFRKKIMKVSCRRLRILGQ